MRIMETIKSGIETKRLAMRADNHSTTAATI